MVYSRRPAVTGKLTGLVSQRQMEKEYLAVLTGHPQSPADTLTDLLFRDAKCNKSYVVSRMRKGVREASLSYEELGRADALSLVCIRLHTGRTHQIRVQFSSRGLVTGATARGTSSAARRSGRGSSPSATTSPASPSPAPTSPRTNTRGTCFKKIFPNKRQSGLQPLCRFLCGAGEPCLSLWESCHRR